MSHTLPRPMHSSFLTSRSLVRRVAGLCSLALLLSTLAFPSPARANVTIASVKDFGARGDGVSDDSVAIRTAIRLLPAPRRLVFPAGTYVFSNVLVDSGTELVFESGAAGVLPTGSTTSDNFFYAQGTATAPVTDISLRGGTFTGRPIGRSVIVVIDGSRITVSGIAAKAVSKAVGFQSCDNVTVQDCVAEYTHIGFVFDDSKHVVISGCTSKNSERDGIIFYNRSRYTVAENNLVEDYMTSDGTGVGGIQVYGSTDATITGNVVRRGHHDAAGIRFRDAEAFWCEGNTVESPGSSGYQVHRVGDYVGLTGGNGTFVNNTVTGARLRGFDVPDPLIKRVVIVGNTVRNTVGASTVSPGSGIVVMAKGSTVIGNTIDTGTGPGIEVGSSAQILAWNEVRNVASVNLGPRVGVFLSGTAHGVVANTVTDGLGHMVNGIRVYAGGSAMMKGNYVAGSTAGDYDVRGTSLSVLRSDRTPPSITVTRAEPSAGSALITVNASDTQSRVEAVRIEAEGVRTYLPGGSGSVLVPDATHVLEIAAIDSAGNIAQTERYYGLAPRRMKLTSASPTTTIAYGTYARFAGVMTDGTDVPIANALVAMQRWNPSTWKWDNVATSTTDVSGVWRVAYSMRISGLYRAAAPDWSTGYQPSATPSYRMSVRAYLTSPSGPSLGTGGKWYAYSGTIRPRHASGSKPVILRFYRYESGRWVRRRTVYAAASTIVGGSRYSAWLALPVGRWYVRAYHADAEHAPTYSTSRYFRLR